jgi:preprotein translocase subunit YajC
MDGGLIVFAFLILIFWLFLVRPQRTRAREQRELIASLEPGDEIVTTGGVYGVIERIEGDVLHVEVADGIVLRTARAAVAGIVEHDEAEDEEESEETPGEPPQSGYSEGAS